MGICLLTFRSLIAAHCRYAECTLPLCILHTAAMLALLHTAALHPAGALTIGLSDTAVAKNTPCAGMDTMTAWEALKFSFLSAEALMSSLLFPRSCRRM